jgi:hypothetical protein
VPVRWFSAAGNGNVLAVLAVLAGAGAEVAGPAEPCCAAEVHALAASVAAQTRARAAPRRARWLVTRLTEPHHRTAAWC